MSVIRATLRTSMALVIGILVAFITIMCVEQIAHLLFPLSVDLGQQDTSASTQYMKNLPVISLLMVQLAWCMGIALGIFSAALVARQVRGRFALAIGTLISGSALATMLLLPHPLWFIVLSAICLPVVSLGCWWCLKRSPWFSRK